MCLNLIIAEDNSRVGRILKALANFSVAAKRLALTFLILYNAQRCRGGLETGARACGRRYTDSRPFTAGSKRAPVVMSTLSSAVREPLRLHPAVLATVNRY